MDIITVPKETLREKDLYLTYMSEAPAGVVGESEVAVTEPEIANAEAVRKPEIIGTVETNKGREVKADDLLCFSDRRGPDFFAKILVEGRVSSPALAQNRDRRDEPLLIAGSKTIFTSLYGPYWSDSCAIVFNAWDTLRQFRFYDQGNTGLKLYDKDADQNPAEFRFGEEFLILSPNDDQDLEMYHGYLGNLMGKDARKEMVEKLGKHVVDIRDIKNAAVEATTTLLEENPEYKSAIKYDLLWRLTPEEGYRGMERDDKEKASLLLESGTDSDLANFVCFDLDYRANFASRDGGHGSATYFFQNKKSTDLYGERYFNKSFDQNYKNLLLKLRVDLSEKMQEWLKGEFQRRFGDKSGRKATLEKSGPPGNERCTLTIQ